MFTLIVKPHAYPVQVTTRRADDKTSILILRPFETREFEVTGETQHEFEEIPHEPLLGQREAKAAE